MKKTLIGLLTALLLLSGCLSPELRAQTAVALTDTARPTPTATRTPTRTSTPTDTPTPTLTPTDTLTPTLTPTDTPVPSITPSLDYAFNITVGKMKTLLREWMDPLFSSPEEDDDVFIYKGADYSLGVGVFLYEYNGELVGIQVSFFEDPDLFNLQGQARVARNLFEELFPPGAYSWFTANKPVNNTDSTVKIFEVEGGELGVSLVYEHKTNFYITIFDMSYIDAVK